MIADALISYLSSDAAVTAAVEGRIYAGIAPASSTYPLIQFSQISGRRLPVLSDQHTLKGPTIQVDIFTQQSLVAGHGMAASTHVTKAQQIAAMVETAMEDFRGIFADVQVQHCHLEGERELIEDGLARVSQDYQIWWKETN